MSETPAVIVPKSVEELLGEVLTNDDSPKYTFFAGAGISIDSGLPNFMNFGRNMIQKICGENWEEIVSPEDLDRMLYLLRPEVLLQSLATTFGDKMCEFSEWLLGETPNPAHKFLAKALERGHLVITTNLDRLIEIAYKDLTGKLPRVIASAEEFHTLAQELQKDGKPSCPTIVKPHGTIDINHEEPAQRYATVRTCIDQVGQGLNTDARLVVEYYLKNGPTVFMGYSGCDHFSITPVLCVTGRDQKAIWLFFDGYNEIIDTHAPIKETHADILRQVYGGKVYADINRGMELHAVCDILLSRNDITKWRGNVSQLFKDLTGEQDFQKAPSITFTAPAWTKDVTEFQKHLMACSLWKKANQQKKCLASADKALSSATGDEKSKAQIKMVVADIELEKSTAESYIRAKKLLEECVVSYKAAKDLNGANESAIEIANVMRRQRNFRDAMQAIERVEKTLTDGEHYDGLKKHLIRVLMMRGLITGLSGDKEFQKPEKAIGTLKAAVEAATTNGYVFLKTGSLNSLGLVLFQQAGESIEKLTEAEACLLEALDLNVYCGQTRSCFQQYRNLGLVHAKMASLETDKTKQQWLYEKAFDDYTNAEAYLQRSISGFVEGEILEAKFRQGEALIKLGRHDAAIETLLHVIARRQFLKDWHNEARTIDLILHSSKTQYFAQWMGRLIDIYYDVLNKDAKMKLFKSQGFRYANAKDIFMNAIQKAIYTGYDGLASDLKTCFNKLDEVIHPPESNEAQKQ